MAITGDPHCTACKLHKTCNTVCLMGSGNRNAEVMIIGDIPGRQDDELGDSFTGRAGDMLDELLATAGLTRNQVYVTNAIHCRPPGGRTPTKAEIRSCKKWIEYEISKVDPAYIMILGNIALQTVMDLKGIKKLRGKPVEFNGRIIIPTYHPTFALRDPNQRVLIDNDFIKLKEVMDFGGIPEERELSFIIVDDMKQVGRMLADLKGVVSSDLETSRLYPFFTELDQRIKNGEASKDDIKEHKATHGGKLPHVVAIGFGTAKYQWIIPGEEAGIWTREQLTDIVDQVTEKLEDCYLVGQNWKFDALWMRERFGVVWNADFDTMMAHYLLDENSRHGLKDLAQRFLGALDWDVGGDVKTTWSMVNSKYHAHDLYYTRKLFTVLNKKLQHDTEIQRVFEHIVMPCVKLFTEIEYDGIYIDQSKMDDAEDYLREQIAEAERNLDRWAHPEWAEVNKETGKPTINWGSSQQLAHLLFDDLKIDPIEKTKGGSNSTSESVLLRIDHPMVTALLKWRGASKQLSAFIDGWRPYLDLRGYLHPSFKLHGTVTGRLSCEHPNLQQVPRDPRIRSLITAPSGWELLEADLSQIELRIAADLANEVTMLQAFNTGIDTHWLTALREVERSAAYKDEVIETAYRFTQKKHNYSDSIELMLENGPDTCQSVMPLWKEVRKKAKAINFGYLYGMWWKKFKIYARDNYGVDVTDREAQESRKTFFSMYSRFEAWHNRQRRFARMYGYVRSLSGRKRRLPDAMSSRDTPQRREAERQAINSPVQSFANELNLMAALQLRSEFGRDKVRLCGTVHDACLFRVKIEWVPAVYKRMLEIMSDPDLLQKFEINLNVPLEAEAKIGPWGIGVGLEKWLKRT